MNTPYNKEWWEASWRTRMATTQAVLGPTEPSGQVKTFCFPDPRHMVPGACAVAFRPRKTDSSFLTISLGLSQPLDQSSAGNPWEFAVYAPIGATWPSELLYDLVLGHAEHPGWITEGHCLPLTFYRNKDGNLDCGAIDASQEPRIVPVGTLRSLYLWRDMKKHDPIVVDGRPYFLMVATGITADEEHAGDTTSPPHVLLFLRKMGIGQVTDPMRQSAFELPGAAGVWQSISAMSHNEVLAQLA